MKQQLQRIYAILYRHFGPQHWWPAKTTLEVIVGAILTQNTAWTNVERAISNLRTKRFLSFQRLLDCDQRKLAKAITSAGYFNVKAKRLKNLLVFFRDRYRGNLAATRTVKTSVLRQELLAVNGVGPETADSILLYAFRRPRFVVDAYTKRIFSRVRLIPQEASYESVQALFEQHLPADARLFNEYHALLVKLGKEYCKKKNPSCTGCPLRDEGCRPRYTKKNSIGHCHKRDTM